MGDLNKKHIILCFIKLCQGLIRMNISVTFLTHCFAPSFSSFYLSILINCPEIAFIYLSSFFLYSSSFFFFILILCLILFIFFSSLCHSRCCPSIVRQPSVPSNSSFLEVMMNKYLWGLFIFYFFLLL